MVTTPLSNDSSSSSSAIPPPVRSQGKAPRFAEDIVLEVKRLSKRFDDALAVDDVNLQVKRGEIFALLGGSGSEDILGFFYPETEVMQNLYVQVEKPQDILRARTRTWNRVKSGR